ncbi:integral membrane protein [Neurospora crassa OR74A]|uniref:Integral membrane protein n=1 Tax=Neurospora crassa (strain ATCC 24698 / 74-OR23-1A / CBS 708.71 / DSM 1257 / FGSC 987) TaxID=367110 RepID=Q7SI29_NEUCR|nr:integral membrane protein [Neurospora crassa OR74A]EAA36527.1 integral membrane protein [Neurospora crassa OR74A]|eukprot:XP_965763.1 integral membrane protein [Neurospora crassa OR74A]
MPKPAAPAKKDDNEPSPIIKATLQAAVIAGISNILAQAISAYKDGTPLVIDWVPVFQFFLFGVISTPPNFLWQELLETTFPSHHVSPTREAIASASASDEKALDREASLGTLVEPRLNKGNTFIKWLLDQTVGAAVNTLLFSMFMRGTQAAMQHRATSTFGASPDQSLWFLIDSFKRGNAIQYHGVNWNWVWEESKREFWGLMVASWKFWPFVSIVNFAVLKTVAARSLAGNLAGIAWGVYMSLFAAQ